MTLRSAFEALRPQMHWPVPSTTFNAITSTFGPRIKLSTSKYDWHRGIDINEEEGAPAVAVTDGSVEAITTFPDGGKTVILRHAFPEPVRFHRRVLTEYFTFYMHLSRIEELPEAVEAGVKIGEVGHTGASVVDDHLHFELRVGTRFSLEFQNENAETPEPKFDPHVHPMFLFEPVAEDMHLTLEDLTAHFDCDDNQPLLNRVVFRVRRKRPPRATVLQHVLDFNERRGFDATTTASLDTQDKSRPFIEPLPFGQASRFRTDIVVPEEFIGRRNPGRYDFTITATNIWGETVSAKW